MSKRKQYPIEKATEHWNYINSVLIMCIEKETYTKQEYIDIAKKMYIDSFLHGYKHGKEDNQ